MTKLTSLPNTAPFAPEQIAALDQVIGAASVVQRAWLSGFLAGLDAAEGKAQAAVPAAANEPKPKLLILYATESGNSEALANRTKQDAAKRGFAARVLDMADADVQSLKSAGTIIAIVSTWGDGEPPQRAAPFFRAFMGENAPKLEGVKFAVLALGDSSYAQFCETGRQFDERLAALGATRVAERIELDLDYEAGAKTWLNATLESLAPAAPGSVIHVDFQKPAPVASKTTHFAAEITTQHKLTSERADSETYHVELDLAGSGLTYEPGDAIAVQPVNAAAQVAAIQKAAGLPADAALTEALATRYDINTLTAKQMKDYAALTGDKVLGALAEDTGKRNEFLAGRQLIDLLETFPHQIEPEKFTALLRPLAPRSYSVASSQKLVGEEAHLTIARLAYSSAGRARLGVASTLISDHRRAGDSLDVFVKPNPHFRLPAAGAKTPIVMIGAGTGVAPYRGFLQELEATGAANDTWLVFGHRHFLYDFLYQLEIQDWLKSGVLGRLDLASSRDQPEKRYVQHVLWEQRNLLRQKLDDGATIYLCGDAKHMARDVDATLMRILSEDKAGGGQDALDALISTGRYKKDVY